MADDINFSGIELPEQTSEQPLEEGTLNSDQLAEVQKDINLEKKFGDQNLKAFSAGVARGASFGISDQVLTKSGLVDSQTLRELEYRNKSASIAGEAAGVIGSAFVPVGGLVGGVAKAGAVAEQITAKTLGKILTETGKRSLASKIIEKSLPKVAGSAVEGGFYGAGQLISEDALGTRDFNAENLISSVGTGAIIGGLAGSVFKGIEELTPVLKSGAKNVNEKVVSYLNPQDAALELIGASSSKKLKLKKTRPDLVEELPDFLKNKAELGILTTDRKLFENIEKIKDDAGEKIGNILKELDVKTSLAPNLVPSKRELYTKIIQDLDENFINKFKNSPEYSSKVAPIKRIRNEYNKLAEVAEGNFTPVEIDTMRRQLDAVIKYDKIPGTVSLVEDANRATRKILRSEIDNIADKVSTNSGLEGSANLATQLRNANKDFSISAEILPFVEGKLDKKRLLNFTDLLGGAGLIGILKEAGAAIAITKKLGESDIARRLKVLTQIETQNNAVENDISKSVKSFFSPNKEVIQPTSINVLLNTSYGRENIDGKKPSTKLEAFNNIQKNFNTLKTEPEKYLDTLRNQTLSLSKHAPGTQAEVIATMQKAIQFLGSKLPKDPKDPSIFPISKWQPSSVELAKFERYLEAVENPKSALANLRQGTLSPEAVEALSVVYPNLYGRVQKEVMNKVAEDSESLSYSKRLQLGLLLKMPTDNSLVSKSILKLQSSYIPKDQPGLPKSKKIEKLGQQIATPIEKTITRE